MLDLWWSIVQGLIVGVGALILVLRLSAAVPHFLRSKYLAWIAVAVGFSFASPLITAWASPRVISLTDAFLLRSRQPGWNYIVISYSALVGLLLGGAIALARTSVGSRHKGP